MLGTGANLPKSLNPIYCDYCQKNVLPGLIQKYMDSFDDEGSIPGLTVTGTYLNFE